MNEEKLLRPDSGECLLPLRLDMIIPGRCSVGGGYVASLWMRFFNPDIVRVN